MHKWSDRSSKRLHALRREGLASIWLGSRSQNPHFATAGPVSSFLFHLPAAGLLTNSYRNRAAPSGSRVPEESPQQPGNADRVLTRGQHLRGRTGFSPPRSQSWEASDRVPAPGRWVPPSSQQHFPGDRALSAPRREPPKAPCASGSRLAFRKALSTPPKSEKPQPPQAHLCAGGVQGGAGRRHPCTESKHCGEVD